MLKFFSVLWMAILLLAAFLSPHFAEAQIEGGVEYGGGSVYVTGDCVIRGNPMHVSYIVGKNAEGDYVSGPTSLTVEPTGTIDGKVDLFPYSRAVFKGGAGHPDVTMHGWNNTLAMTDGRLGSLNLMGDNSVGSEPTATIDGGSVGLASISDGVLNLRGGLVEHLTVWARFDHAHVEITGGSVGELVIEQPYSKYDDPDQNAFAAVVITGYDLQCKKSGKWGGTSDDVFTILGRWKPKGAEFSMRIRDEGNVERGALRFKLVSLGSSAQK